MPSLSLRDEMPRRIPALPLHGAFEPAHRAGHASIWSAPRGTLVQLRQRALWNAWGGSKVMRFAASRHPLCTPSLVEEVRRMRKAWRKTASREPFLAPISAPHRCGGAPIEPRADRAREMGIPVYEGMPLRERSWSPGTAPTPAASAPWASLFPLRVRIADDAKCW